MNVKSLILYGKESLNNITDTPRLESELLLSYVLKTNRERILANLKRDVPLFDEKAFKSLVEKRKDYYPLPYITNHKEFMGLDFFVQEGVFIPRPETEILVEEAIRRASGKEYLLDIGTGSGCIILSFLYYNKKSRGIGIDISDIPIRTAKRNALKLNLSDRVDFIQRGLSKLKFGEEFDIILSNPPYIRTENCKSLPFEPVQALDGGNDGFDIYPEVIKKSYNFLKKNGLLIIEIDQGLDEKVKKMMKKIGFIKVKLFKDFAGLYRVAEGVK